MYSQSGNGLHNETDCSWNDAIMTSNPQLIKLGITEKARTFQCCK